VEEIGITMPTSISLKRAATVGLDITIQNKSKETMNLADSMVLTNKLGKSLGVNPESPRIFKQTLLPGESVSTESEDLLNSIEQITLTGQSAAKGNLMCKVIYNLGGQAKSADKAVAITVSDVHLRADEAATKLFNKKKMVWVSKAKGYVFVEPEADTIYQSGVAAWQAAHQNVETYSNNLRESMIGLAEPEILSFFKTVKELNEATTPQKIVETTLRSVTPSIITGTYDLLSLKQALTKQQTEEKAWLKYFGASSFAVVPIFNEQGKTIGQAKAIIKKQGHKTYVLKLGDL
jgi:hypothetical protein